MVFELAVADNIVEVKVTLEEMVASEDIVKVIECVLLFFLVAVEVIGVVVVGGFMLVVSL